MTEVPNYIVLAHCVDQDIARPVYYVPVAKDEEHAISQVREFLFRVVGIKTPWDPKDVDCPLKIARYSAVKLKNDTIQAV